MRVVHQRDGYKSAGCKKKSRMMKFITRLSNSSAYLRYAERGKCRLIDHRCDRQPVISLESCDGLPGHRPKDAIDRPIIVTVALQLLLNVNCYLIGRQSIVAIDWTVIRIIRGRGITPRREPVARVPIIPATIHKHDSVVMASPPTAIVPLPVVIAERRIPLTAERSTVDVVIDSRIASTVIGEVAFLVGSEVSVPINRQVIASTKLVGVSFTINFDIPCSIHRYVSFAIDSSVVSRAKLLVPRNVSFAIRLHPRVLIHRSV